MLFLIFFSGKDSFFIRLGSPGNRVLSGSYLAGQILPRPGLCQVIIYE